MFGQNIERVGAAIRRGLCRYLRDRRGNISTMVALLILPLVGVMGLATETGNWYLIHRSMQNAADSAVLAAAQNGTINPGGATYLTEGRSVSSNFGFTNGANSTVVTPVNGQACPAPLAGSGCYKVTIIRDVPISMLRVVGYTGTAGSGSQTITASAMAGVVNQVTNYCVLSLAASGTGIRINGGPNVDFSGCNLMSDSNSGSAETCNGQNPGADSVSAVGTADAGCGHLAHSGATAIADPYSSLAATNASDLNDTCGGAYPGQSWAAGKAFTSLYTACGNVVLSGNVTVPSGTRLVIQNGTLDLHGHTLTGTGVTLAFNTPAGGPNIAPFASGGGVVGTGTLTISAPDQNSGSPWQGVAIYQNRQNGSTTPVAMTYDGNKPQWNVTGLVYLPYIDLTFKGIVSKDGLSCFALIANTFLISGNGAIYDNPMSECIAAGLVLPNNIVSSRVALVQ
jgi:Flp pilus assembly protein TadG